MADFLLPLTNSTYRAIIDAEDAAKVLAMGSWRLRTNGYAQHVWEEDRRMRCVCLSHVVIGPPPKGWVIDHINSNRLDNRKANLRPVSPAVNAWNKSPHTSRVGGCRGIAWLPAVRHWEVNFIKYGKTYCLGRYESFLEAKAAATLGMAILYGRNTQFYDDCLLGSTFDEVVARGPALFALLPGKARTRLVSLLHGTVHPDALRLYLGV